MSNVIELYNKGGWYIAYKAGIVFAQANGISTSSDSWAVAKCPYTLPKKYCPRVEVNVAACSTNGGSWTGLLYISKEGYLNMKNMGNNGTSEARYAAASWPV